MTRKLNIVLLCLVIVVGLPLGWLLLETSTLGHAARPVTITQLRRLAGTMRGLPPTEVRYEVIGRRRVMSNLLAAGSGLRPVTFVIRVYELVLPQGQVITIDRGMGRQLAEAHRIRDFDPEALAMVNRAVAVSQRNLVLATDVQHSGLATASAAFGSGLDDPLGPAPRRPYAVAPGVVAIPAGDVAPGDRMIYVRLADGHEVLFTGDIAPVRLSWQEQRPPARLVTTFLVGDDREAIAAWLRTIAALRQSAPGLQIVAGHDPVLPRLLVHGFTSDPAPARVRP